MKYFALILYCILLTGCETVNFGLAYQGKYADYQVQRSVTNGQGAWNVNVVGGKNIVPFRSY
jgi:hypothetical protein